MNEMRDSLTRRAQSQALVAASKHTRANSRQAVERAHEVLDQARALTGRGPTRNEVVQARREEAIELIDHAQRLMDQAEDLMAANKHR